MHGRVDHFSHRRVQFSIVVYIAIGDILLHVLKFINKDSFLVYKLQHELNEIDCYANGLVQ
jgi:hypothetical protein